MITGGEGIIRDDRVHHQVSVCVIEYVVRIIHDLDWVATGYLLSLRED